MYKEWYNGAQEWVESLHKSPYSYQAHDVIRLS